MLRQLFVAILTLPLLLLSLSAHSRSYYYDDDSYYDDGYSYNSRYYNDGYSRNDYYDDGYNYNYRSRYSGGSYRHSRSYDGDSYYSSRSYSSRLPSQISAQGEKVIVVDPRVHAWGAYTPEGSLVKAGLVTAGSHWCPDIHRPCRTRAGSFRIFSLGDRSCKSHKYPIGRGGARMPYCMYFNGGQGLHGSYEVVEGNISHGCVRMHVSDAEWLRFNFAHVGTKVIVRPY